MRNTIRQHGQPGSAAFHSRTPTVTAAVNNASGWRVASMIERAAAVSNEHIAPPAND